MALARKQTSKETPFSPTAPSATFFNGQTNAEDAINTLYTQVASDAAKAHNPLSATNNPSAFAFNAGSQVLNIPAVNHVLTAASPGVGQKVALFVGGTEVDYSETLTLLQQPTLAGSVLTLKYKGEDGTVQTQTVDLASLTQQADISSAVLDPNTYILTVTENDGKTTQVNLSSLIKVTVTNVAAQAVTIIGDGSAANPLSADVKLAAAPNLITKDVSGNLLGNQPYPQLNSNPATGNRTNGTAAPTAVAASWDFSRPGPSYLKIAPTLYGNTFTGSTAFALKIGQRDIVNVGGTIPAFTLNASTWETDNSSTNTTTVINSTGADLPVTVNPPNGGASYTVTLSAINGKGVPNQGEALTFAQIDTGAGAKIIVY